MILEQLVDIRTGEKLAGFFIRNKNGKAIAIGALTHFVKMCAKRYEADKPLCRKVERMTGLKLARIEP